MDCSTGAGSEAYVERRNTQQDPYGLFHRCSCWKPQYGTTVKDCSIGTGSEAHVGEQHTLRQLWLFNRSCVWRRLICALQAQSGICWNSTWISYLYIYFITIPKRRKLTWFLKRLESVTLPERTGCDLPGWNVFCSSHCAWQCWLRPVYGNFLISYYPPRLQRQINWQGWWMRLDTGDQGPRCVWNLTSVGRWQCMDQHCPPEDKTVHMMGCWGNAPETLWFVQRQSWAGKRGGLDEVCLLKVMFAKETVSWNRRTSRGGCAKYHSCIVLWV